MFTKATLLQEYAGYPQDFGKNWEFHLYFLFLLIFLQFYKALKPLSDLPSFSLQVEWLDSYDLSQILHVPWEYGKPIFLKKPAQISPYKA